MPVMFATEPKGSLAALADGLSALGAASSPHVTAVAGSESPPPLPVYAFPVDELAQGNDPRNESPVAWKYLLVCGNQTVRTADVVHNHQGQNYEFASITGADAAAINNAIEAAEKDPATANNDYEMRLVQVPALYVTALWLKNQDKNRD